MALSKERKGEIALLAFKARMKKEGVKLDDSLLRDIGNMAKSIGIPKEDVEVFIEELVREIVDEMFPPL